MITKENLFSKADMDSAIVKVKTDGEAYMQLVHKTGCSAILHAQDSGDSHYMTKLVNALPKGLRKNAMIDWFMEFTPFDWEGKGENARFVKNKSKSREFNLEAALAKPFYDGFNSKEGVEWSERTDLKRVIGFLKSHAEKAKEKGKETYAAKLDKAAAILTQ